MAFTAATSQALVQTTLNKLDVAQTSIEQYMLVNNPALLAGVITDLAAVTAAITAVNA
jgi:hypothetical protein